MKAEVRAAYRTSVDAGRPLTGAELGRQFDRTDRWGRMQIARLREEEASGNGHHPPTSIRDGDEEIRDAPVEIRETGGTHRDRDAVVFGRWDGGRSERAQPPAEPRPSPRDPGRPWLDTAITLVVGIVAAAASYGHMLEVAMLAGEPLWIARAFPITVDGLVLAALRRGEEGRRWLALGVAVSVASNVLAQFPEHAVNAGPIVSAWPPLALYGTHRLLLHRDRRDNEEGTDQ